MDFNLIFSKYIYFIIDANHLIIYLCNRKESLFSWDETEVKIPARIENKISHWNIVLNKNNYYVL